LYETPSILAVWATPCCFADPAISSRSHVACLSMELDPGTFWATAGTRAIFPLRVFSNSARDTRDQKHLSLCSCPPEQHELESNFNKENRKANRKDKENRKENRKENKDPPQNTVSISFSRHNFVQDSDVAATRQPEERKKERRQSLPTVSSPTSSEHQSFGWVQVTWATYNMATTYTSSASTPSLDLAVIRGKLLDLVGTTMPTCLNHQKHPNQPSLIRLKNALIVLVCAARNALIVLVCAAIMLINAFL